MDIPPVAYAAALAGLPQMAPARLRGLLQRHEAPAVWDHTLHGALTRLLPVPPLPEQRERLQLLARHASAEASRVDPGRVWQQCLDLGVSVALLDDPTYPAALAADHAAPAVLFHRGDLGALDGPRVAVVGTRSSSAGGRQLAARLGEGLAGAGVRVVSGLAKGIDGAAHQGALRVDGAPPIGVAGTGHAHPYPTEHASLWDQVIARGVLFAEVPPHCTPLPFRFPARNRLLAALADAVVVVESRARGGSMITVDEAARRSVPVLAVPGLPGTRGAEGTNQLIYDGCQLVRDHIDVLVQLGLLARPSVTPDARSLPAAGDQQVLDLIGGEPADLEAVVAATGWSIADALASLARLEDGGHVERVGPWYQPVPPVPTR